MKNAGGILIGVALNLWIALGSVNILTVFILPVHSTEYLSTYLCCVQFLSSMFYRSQRSFTSLVKFIPRYFIIFDAITNGIVFLISLSSASL